MRLKPADQRPQAAASSLPVWLKRAWVVVLCSGVWACSEPDPAPQPSPSADGAAPVTCEQVCDRHIACDNDPDPLCAARCALALGVCPEASQVLGRCLLAQEDDAFECNAEGYTLPRAGVCTDEQAELEQCVTQALGS